MKKSLLALVVLGAFAGAASAQSSVVIFGKIDQAIAKPIGTKNKQIMDTAGSRIAFRGSEDLGGGLSAIFAFEHRFNPDTGTNAAGTASSPAPNRFWEGFSYVGVRSATLGGITIGRQYTSSFLNVQNNVDPFAGETVAALRTIFMGGAYGSAFPGAGAVTGVIANDAYNTWAGGASALGPAKGRQDNMVKYSATFSGVSLSADIAERNGGVDVKRPYSAALSYAGGPFWGGIAFENAGGQYDRVLNVAAKYTFGGKFTLSAGLSDGRINAATNNKLRSYIVGANIAVGSGDIKVGYAAAKVAGTQANARLGVGYHHNLSKRTKLYVDFAHESKQYYPSPFGTIADKNGYDLGIQHQF